MSVKVRELRPGRFYIVHHSPELPHGRETRFASTDKRKATTMAREFERDLARVAKRSAARPEQAGPTFRSVCESWLRSHRDLAPATRELYELQLERRFYATFGERPIRSITHPELREYFGRLFDEEKASRSTAKNLLAPVRQAFAFAAKDGIMGERANPADGLSEYFPRAKRQEEVSTFLTRAEREAFLGAAAQAPRWHALFQVAIRAGLRIGEVFGLQPDDLDLDAARIVVQRSVRDGSRVGSTKSGRARSVDIPRQLVPILRAHLAWRAKYLLGRGITSPWLFPSESGAALHKSTFHRSVLRPMLKKAGIKRRVRFHDLRHTYAATLIEAGAHPKGIADQMGHASPDITHRIYSHLERGVLRPLIDGLMDDEGGAAVKAAR